MVYNSRTSVRNLVEFVYREGDLDLRFQGKTKMVDGIKLHQKIQESQGSDYLSEVSLQVTHVFDMPETGDMMALLIAGRADGLLETSNGYVIDEIKGVSRALDDINEETYPLHWAQAKFYGFIYCTDHGLDEITIQITYATLEDYEIKRFKKLFTYEMLYDFYIETVSRYEKWLKMKVLWQKKRNAAILKMAFPFETYRKGQRAMAVSVYQAIKNKERMFIEAPTGIGKTMSTLFPSIKAMGEGHSEKIFYLSAKSITKGVAEEAINILKEHDLEIKSLTLTAKDKTCFLEKATCYPEKCPYAKGHFNRVGDALWEILNEATDYNRESIEAMARRHTVCPYEFSLDLSRHADLVICDYNYAFDPRVYLRRFFEMPNEAYTFLIDEAHNLVDRARTMFSATLSKANVMAVKKILGDTEPKLRKELDSINRMILEMRKKCDDSGIYVDNDELGDIYTQLRRRATNIEAWLVKAHGFHAYDEVLDLYFEIVSYMRISELYGDGHLFYMTGGNGQNTEIKLFCINPAENLSRFIANAQSAIFFSATLTPIDYFKKLLIKDVDDLKSLRLPSPFPEENKLAMIAKDISVTYQNRDRSKDAICDYIYDFISIKKGNYLVFCPSYAYLRTLSEAFEERFESECDLLIQERQMDETERELFLRSFDDQRSSEKSLVGFAVIGGVFSEGIDLRQDRLIGAVIISVGLPMLSFENNLVKAYFDDENGNGYAYAYQFPGINKVMQAAGRVIRGHEDRGAILFIDQRYLQKGYMGVFEPYYRQRIIDRDEMTHHLQHFWKV